MRNQAFNLVREAVTRLNEELDEAVLRDPGEETPIFGGDQGIDSLSLVRLIVDLEGEVERELGQRVTLADEKAMSMAKSPYRSVGALTDFVVSQLEPHHA